MFPSVGVLLISTFLSLQPAAVPNVQHPQQVLTQTSTSYQSKSDAGNAAIAPHTLTVQLSSTQQPGFVNSTASHSPVITSSSQHLSNASIQQILDATSEPSNQQLKPLDLLAQAGQLRVQADAAIAAESPLPKNPVNDPHISSTMQPVGLPGAESSSHSKSFEGVVVPMSVDSGRPEPCAESGQTSETNAHSIQPQPSPALSPVTTSESMQQG